MFSIPCVIFAGGKSSRMGEDKALLPFGGFSTLTQYQYNKLSQLFSHVYISTKNSTKFDFEANFIEDIEDVYAPTLGFISAFKTLKVDAFFAISVDTPFITQEIFSKIINTDKKNYNATIAKLNGKVQPLCGIYHQTLLNDFEEMLREDRHKLGFLLQKKETKYVAFEDENLFLNLNHPHEYTKALNLL